jgi:hypothetical protein
MASPKGSAEESGEEDDMAGEYRLFERQTPALEHVSAPDGIGAAGLSPQFSEA